MHPSCAAMHLPVASTRTGKQPRASAERSIPPPGAPPLLNPPHSKDDHTAHPRSFAHTGNTLFIPEGTHPPTSATPPSWPTTLRAVRSWLTPAITLTHW